MIVPDTPIQPLDNKATLPEVVAKVNEIITAINLMWNPDSGTS